MLYESEITFKELLRICQTNKDLAKKYITKLYHQYNPIYENIKVNKPLLSLISFAPLPYEFQTEYLSKNDTVNKSNNIYSFLGEPGNRILYANRRVPSCDKDAVPFTIPITTDDTTELIQSNVFYYEVTILPAHIREPFNNQCVSIGFGTNRTPYLNHVGWTEESWGFHSDDGNFMNSNRAYNVTQPWGLGDTVGVGLIYDNKNEYRLLLTKNGIIIDDNNKIKTHLELYPMIGLDLSSPIFVNWGQKKFKFELQKYISCNKIINNNITFLSRPRDITSYRFVPPQSLNKKINIFNFGENIKKMILTEKISSISSLLENSIIDKLGIKVLQYDPKTNEVNQTTTNIDISNNSLNTNLINNNNYYTNTYNSFDLSSGIHVSSYELNNTYTDISSGMTAWSFGFNNSPSSNYITNVDKNINLINTNFLSLTPTINTYVQDLSANQQPYWNTNIDTPAVWPSVWNSINTGWNGNNTGWYNNNLNVGGNIQGFNYWVPSNLNQINLNGIDLNPQNTEEKIEDNDMDIEDDKTVISVESATSKVSSTSTESKKSVLSKSSHSSKPFS